MRVIETVAGFRQALDEARRDGRSVGLVPTMGYLHDGHASLLRTSAAAGDVVAATIFVNPLQFAPGEDLATYPRDLPHDLTVAEAAGASMLFTPAVEEMYPSPMLTTVSVAQVSEGMEGAVRPTHLDGVATVVAKLFAIAGPCGAYFGEKDWQQLAVVRRMVADLSFPVEVVGCPIVREGDGLAMSSRNVRLTPEHRREAPALARALCLGRRLAEQPGAERAAVRRAIADAVSVAPSAELDYVEVVDDGPAWRLLVAARFGAVRLLDNVGATPCTVA